MIPQLVLSSQLTIANHPPPLQNNQTNDVQSMTIHTHRIRRCVCHSKMSKTSKNGNKIKMIPQHQSKVRDGVTWRTTTERDDMTKMCRGWVSVIDTVLKRRPWWDNAMTMAAMWLASSSSSSSWCWFTATTDMDSRDAFTWRRWRWWWGGGGGGGPGGVLGGGGSRALGIRCGTGTKR